MKLVKYGSAQAKRAPGRHTGSPPKLDRAEACGRLMLRLSLPRFVQAAFRVAVGCKRLLLGQKLPQLEVRRLPCAGYPTFIGTHQCRQCRPLRLGFRFRLGAGRPSRYPGGALVSRNSGYTRPREFASNFLFETGLCC